MSTVHGDKFMLYRWPPQSSVSSIIPTGYGQRRRTKPPTRSCVKRYPLLSIPCARCFLIWTFLSPGGTYSAPDVCAPPPTTPPFSCMWPETGPWAEFWVISRSHPTPSIAAPFWGERKWQRRLSRAELPSWVDQRTENRLWIVIRPSLQSPSLPTSSYATKCLLSSSQGVSFNCQLIFLPPACDNMSHSKMQPRPAQGGHIFLASWTASEYSSKRDRMLQPHDSLSASHNN